MTARWAFPVADLMALRSRARDPHAFIAVIHATAQAANISVADLLGQDRRRSVAHPRQVAMALCRELPGASLHAVAAAFGRDHSTVVHAERAVAARMTPALAEAMDRIRARLAEAREAA